jgi:hypothetical protein
MRKPARFKNSVRTEIDQNSGPKEYASYPTDPPLREGTPPSAVNLVEVRDYVEASSCSLDEGHYNHSSLVFIVLGGLGSSVPNSLASSPDLESTNLFHLLLIGLTVVGTAIVIQRPLGL